MQIGIVGLPNSTKTTIFNALTKRQEETSVTSSGQVEVHTAIVEVPDGGEWELDEYDGIEHVAEKHRTWS